MTGRTLHLGDCLDILPTIPDDSVDAAISDPPYPEIDRPYGRMTEAEWHEMMREVVRQTRRVLKPKGSAVFILQPNSRKVGSMRPWLFEFQAWCCREWNIVQDAWWWNTSTMPLGGANKGGLLRPSLKACVWVGEPDCYRDQESVLLPETNRNRRSRLEESFDWNHCPSRIRSSTEGPRDNYERLRKAAERRGGVTPYNVFDLGSSSRTNGGSFGHPASTPVRLVDFWVRYISPPGGVVADWFAGSGTMGLAALKRGRSFIGIERDPEYHAIAERRLQALMVEPPLFAASGAV